MIGAKDDNDYNSIHTRIYDIQLSHVQTYVPFLLKHAFFMNFL